MAFLVERALPEDPGPWPAPVGGYRAPEPGEHPRLLLASQIAEYNQGNYMRLAELARGARHVPASNH